MENEPTRETVIKVIAGMAIVIGCVLALLIASGCEAMEDDSPTDGGVADAAPTDTATETETEVEFCTRLLPAVGLWYNEENGKEMTVTLEELDGTCGATFEGPGALFTGLFTGTKWPLTRNEDGCQTEYVDIIHLYLKNDLVQKYHG